MKNKIKLIITKFLILILLTASAMPSYAMIVYDPIAVGKLVEELNQLRYETEYLKDQLVAIKRLQGNEYDWSNAQELINQLGDTVDQGNSLAYSASDINQQFKQHYPGYVPPENFQAQYRNNTNMTLNTLNNVLQGLGSNAQDFQNENTRLAFLQRQSQNAKGQTQAIQAASQIASEQVSQLQLLRQTVIAQTNAQAAYYATNIQNKAGGQAELVQIIDNGSTKPPKRTYSDAVHLPDGR